MLPQIDASSPLPSALALPAQGWAASKKALRLETRQTLLNYISAMRERPLAFQEETAPIAVINWPRRIRTTVISSDMAFSLYCPL